MVDTKTIGINLSSFLLVLVTEILHLKVSTACGMQ